MDWFTSWNHVILALLGAYLVGAVVGAWGHDFARQYRPYRPDRLHLGLVLVFALVALFGLATLGAFVALVASVVVRLT